MFKLIIKQSFRLFYIHFIIFLFLIPKIVRAQNEKDIDVLKYSIRITDLNSKTNSIKGNSIVQLRVTSANVKQIHLSLFSLIIDSIKIHDLAANYSYDGNDISISSQYKINSGDTLSYQIFYHGHPQKDTTGWGGFYFVDDYAFNLGIGFGSKSHPIGKNWFPCHDTFDDKAYFDFSITTSPKSRAICNGILTSQYLNSDGTIIWNWKMNQKIPPYLACISVGPFYIIHETSNGIPVEIACLSQDSELVKNSFKNLDIILANYISMYGPYPFDKVGFTLVPFNLGAMEHASSITIGNVFIDGTLNYETLWAHELSHMWWGDEVTCLSEREIWLNEGFASYNEALTIKKLYGKEKYNLWLRQNHKRALHYLLNDENGDFALDAMPHSQTYGTTVYSKAPDIIHSLHELLGDSAFFNGCKNYLSKHKYGNATSIDLSNDLNDLSTTPKINTQQFFNDWISTPGYPHFSIDSISNKNLNYTIYTRQRSKGNSHIYKTSIDLFATNGIQDTIIKIYIDKSTNVFHCYIPFKVKWFILDKDAKVASAITAFTNRIMKTGEYTFPETNVTLNVKNVGNDSTNLRVELNWIKPDGFKHPNNKIRLSDTHYWKIDGIIATGFSAKATFEYNGTTNLTDGYFDNSLIEGSENNLQLLYRTGTAEDWQVVHDFSIQNDEDQFDKKGRIILNQVRKGEYVLGYKK